MAWINLFVTHPEGSVDADGDAGAVVVLGDRSVVFVAIVEERESTARPRPRAKHHAAERDTEAPISPMSAVS